MSAWSAKGSYLRLASSAKSGAEVNVTPLYRTFSTWDFGRVVRGLEREACSFSLCSDDGELYKLEKDYYADAKKRLPAEERGIANELVKLGASFGFMQQTGPGIGVACYLVNLRSLRTEVPELPTPIVE